MSRVLNQEFVNVILITGVIRQKSKLIPMTSFSPLTPFSLSSALRVFCASVVETAQKNSSIKGKGLIKFVSHQ